MIYELSDTSKVSSIFAGWHETLIYSCLEQVMGKIYVTDQEHPRSAMAYVGCFSFFAGEPNQELVKYKPEGFVIMTPQNKAWAKLIEGAYPDAKKATRYAIKKDTKFDVDKLKAYASAIPEGYELKKIDADIYDLCLESDTTVDFVSSFGSKEKYLEAGRGYVLMKNGKIAAGASSYTSYLEGIEIEIDTFPEERKKGLATIVAAALILDCLEDGLYPSWDAQNKISVHLAEKLGYEFDHEYAAYEVN